MPAGACSLSWWQEVAGACSLSWWLHSVGGLNGKVNLLLNHICFCSNKKIGVDLKNIVNDIPFTNRYSLVGIYSIIKLIISKITFLYQNVSLSNHIYFDRKNLTLRYTHLNQNRYIKIFYFNGLQQYYCSFSKIIKNWSIMKENFNINSMIYL